AHRRRARDRPLVLRHGIAPHGDLHATRERAEPARRAEARLPLPGAAASLHPQQRRLARPRLRRAAGGRGTAGRAATLEGRPRARVGGPGARGRPAGRDAPPSFLTAAPAAEEPRAASRNRRSDRWVTAW